MSQPVVIKGNSYGITVILDDKMEFGSLLKAVAEKFQESTRFFKDAKMVVSFEGRTLTDEEQMRLIDTITENSSISIVCIVDQDEEREQKFMQKLNRMLANSEFSSGQFYKGTLRSGQVLESESSIIILGDVNPGGKVIAKGNIIVLGALKGTAWAGAAGNENAFVVALEMTPMQIRISENLARSSDKRTLEDRNTPKIAYMEDGSIYVEPLTKGVLNDIKFN